MSTPLEWIDQQTTPLGELVLRRRRLPGLAEPFLEIQLDGALLMSSLLTRSERELATRTLAAVRGAPRAVVVGGLGLGHTAQAVLDDPGVESLVVVELLEAVIGWHRDRLVPLGASLGADHRFRVVPGDFFALVADERALPAPPGGFDAILVDIDHAPDAWLHDAHGGFYAEGALAGAAQHIRPGGAFGFWSSGPPQPAFLELLTSAFASVAVHDVTVLNPMVDEDQTDTVYVARVAEQG